MMEFEEDGEDQRLMDELANQLTDICRGYSINQVTSATFAIMMDAIGDNDVVSERLHVMNTIMHEVQHRYNTLLHETRRPVKTNLH